MGVYGSVGIYPIGGRAPRQQRMESVARDMISAFELANLLAPGTADPAPAGCCRSKPCGR